MKKEAKASLFIDKKINTEQRYRDINDRSKELSDRNPFVNKLTEGLSCTSMVGD